MNAPWRGLHIRAWRHLSLAVRLGEARRRDNRLPLTRRRSDVIRPTEAELDVAFTLFVAGLRDSTIRRATPLPDDMANELFSPAGFRRGMARMNLSNSGPR